MKRLLVLGLVLQAGACRFWYKPVPVANAIGEEKTVLAGDTVRGARRRVFQFLERARRPARGVALQPFSAALHQHDDQAGNRLPQHRGGDN